MLKEKLNKIYNENEKSGGEIEFQELAGRTQKLEWSRRNGENNKKMG